MASITLSQTESTIFIGWYGTCGTCGDLPFNDASISDQAEYFDLIYQIDEFNTNYNKWNSAQKTFYDLGFIVPKPSGFQCGHAYWVIFKPHPGETEAERTISIPNFVGSWDKSGNRGLLAETCDPVTASCTCSAVVEDTILKVDFDATSLSGTTDGNIKGVEIVFDNVVFGESTHLSATPTTEVNKFKDTSNTSTLNFYYDYSIRTDSVFDAPTDPTNTKSVIGFIDTTENGVGTTTTLLNTITFNVAAEGFTITGDDPIIADVRVYDSSASVVQYDITRCE